MIEIAFASMAAVVTLAAVAYVCSTMRLQERACRVYDVEHEFFTKRIKQIDREEGRAVRGNQLTELRLITERANLERRQRLETLENAALKRHVVAMLEVDDENVRAAAAVFAKYLGIGGPLVERAAKGKPTDG